VSCLDEVVSGSGFLISGDLVVTAGHVVDGAVTIGLTTDEEALDEASTAELVGFSRKGDLALLRSDQRFDSHPLAFGKEPPRVGDRVAALGFPLGGRLSMAQGDVTGLDRELTLDEIDLVGLIETDADVNEGNSGGPLVDKRGRVLGVVSLGPDPALAEGLVLAIPAGDVHESVVEWQGASAAQMPAKCEAPRGPNDVVRFPRLPDDPDAEGIADSLAGYFTAINAGRYEDAWRLQTVGRRQRAGSYEEFRAGHLTTFNTDVEMHSIEENDERVKQAHVTFVSFQDPEFGPEGEDCTLWNLDFAMERHARGWLIDRAVGHKGGPANTPCSAE
jgi:hypothetical protein